MTYCIKTSDIEFHIIKEESPDKALEVLEKHLTTLWGYKECCRLMSNAEFVKSWDDMSGYKCTIYT